MKIDFKSGELAAINMVIRRYYNNEILGKKILKKKPLSFEDMIVKDLKEFFEKNNFPSY